MNQSHERHGSFLFHKNDEKSAKLMTLKSKENGLLLMEEYV